MIAAVVVSFPLMYMSARAAFQAVDARLEDAARTLGAREARVFLTVTLPKTAEAQKAEKSIDVKAG